MLSLAVSITTKQYFIIISRCLSLGVQQFCVAELALASNSDNRLSAASSTVLLQLYLLWPLQTYLESHPLSEGWCQSGRTPMAAGRTCGLEAATVSWDEQGQASISM